MTTWIGHKPCQSVQVVEEFIYLSGVFPPMYSQNNSVTAGFKHGTFKIQGQLILHCLNKCKQLLLRERTSILQDEPFQNKYQVKCPALIMARHLIVYKIALPTIQSDDSFMIWRFLKNFNHFHTFFLVTFSVRWCHLCIGPLMK